MKRILIALVLAAVLAGCAATSYRTARENANRVQNGMTVQEAASVLGMAPSHQTPDLVQWRRGNAQSYDGTRGGAIEFRLKNGKIVDVPDGGIFGPAAVARLDAARQERYKQREEADTAAALAAEELAKRNAAEAKELAERAIAETAAEARAIAASPVFCDDKSTCAKVFALAQIYVNRNADQKIQVATDTIIETYNPTEPGKIGITVTKTPRRASNEVLSIAVVCKDSEFGRFASVCRRERTRIYAGFKQFIQANLAK